MPATPYTEDRPIVIGSDGTEKIPYTGSKAS